MKKSFKLPGVECPDCGGSVRLEIATRRAGIEVAEATCERCGWSLDLMEESRGQVGKAKDKVKRLARSVSDAIVDVRKTLPRDRGEWATIVRDPRHPFTAAVLTGLVLIALELTGFGVFIALVWILGALILNPLGWVLIPIVVAIALAHRSRFRTETREKLKDELDALQRRRDAGELSDGEFRVERAEIIARYFA
ncbi:MAG: hypothetical protein JSU87_01015 [Gemmatimonadota bacterium]|nr:MAG: hypothetical protein JSU87_01015 [Gemmatimonadota bacterium]